MLWYKAWLETRTRFLIGLIGITGLCAYRFYELDKSAFPWANSSYYYFVLHSCNQLLTILWLVAVTLLMMGGLLQEKGAGVSAFTLSMPATRRRLITIRICAGITEAALLAVIPWAALFTIAALTRHTRPFDQTGFYLVLFAGGGAVFVGTALLVSSLVEGTYTAPMVSLGIMLIFGNAPKSWDALNPLEFKWARYRTGPGNMLIGPVPWGQFAAYIGVAVLLIGLAMKLIEERDF